MAAISYWLLAIGQQLTANSFSALLLVGGDLHLDDLVGLRRRLALLDRVDVFHARGDLAPDRVFAVEEGRRREADEELAVGAVRVVGARHRDGAANVLFLAELGGELLSGAAGAGALGIAGLRHEAVDDAVEDDAVVEAVARQLLDPRDGLRREIGAHFDDDAAGRHVEVEGVLEIGCAHGASCEEKGGHESENPYHWDHVPRPPIGGKGATLADGAREGKAQTAPLTPRPRRGSRACARWGRAGACGCGSISASPRRARRRRYRRSPARAS